MDLQRLDTVQVVPPTPFSSDGGTIRLERLAELVRGLAEAGIHAFLPAAGTGEFHSLSVKEVIECVRTTRGSIPASAALIAPIGFQVADAVAIGKGALEAGADALLVMPLVHPYVSDAGFRDYVVEISTRLGAPLLTYKRGPVPSDKLLLELARGGQLIGVKYAVNDVDAFARFASSVSGEPPLGLYCGTAERWAPYFMLAGATGYTSGLGCVAPRSTLALHRLLASGQFAEAMRLVAKFRPIEDYRARDGDSFNISAIKFAVGLRGPDCGPCRPPQRRLTSEEQAEIARLAGALTGLEHEFSLPTN